MIDPENLSHQRLFLTGQALAAITAHRGLHADQEAVEQCADMAVKYADACISALAKPPR